MCNSSSKCYTEGKIDYECLKPMVNATSTSNDKAQVKRKSMTYSGSRTTYEGSFTGYVLDVNN